MNKNKFIIDRSYWHRTRGELGYYSEACAEMQKTNPDPSTVFLEFHDRIWGGSETLEVSINLLNE